ncbi:DUF4333 domain-containing protein [Streptomyces sp. NPDC050145]|uniref:DUF4333 domain-containing protein n=1 Tax=Streptomyces sp. NPDC050145 TaxID=3365602 RepID=UPI00378900E0
MIKPRLSAGVPALVAVAACALLAGCSVEAHVGSSTPKMSKEKVADKIATTLAAQTGQPKPDVTCPEDLEGKVGATGRCTLTASDGSSIGVSVKVTSVEGKQMKFDIQADETASPAPGN